MSEKISGRIRRGSCGISSFMPNVENVFTPANGPVFEWISTPNATEEISRAIANAGHVGRKRRSVPNTSKVTPPIKIDTQLLCGSALAKPNKSPTNVDEASSLRYASTPRNGFN